MSGFVFELGMDIQDFSKSISEVENELKRLKDSLKNATGQGIVETNLQIKKLEQTLVDLKRVGLDKLPQGVTNASNALNSLSQVTRDLPFGFIAIQNNLPLVVDSLGQLSKQAGGVGPALKSIGASLIGPAGLSFAFGAVVAGVTALIQKYGSLGNAYTAIVSGNAKLIETQKEYNKGIAEATANVIVEESKIKILVSTINNLDAPQKQRIAAYNELKKVSPDIVAGIRDENALTAANIDIINKNTQARLQAIKLKIQEAGITSVLTKNAEELANANIALEDANKKVTAAELAYNNQTDTRIKSGIGLVDNLKSELSALTLARVEKEKAQKAVDALIATQDQYLKQLQPIVTETSAINTATKERINLLKKEDTQIKQNEKTGLSALIAKNKKELADFNKELSQPLTFETAYVNLFPKLDEQLKKGSKGLEAFRKQNVEVETNKKGPEFIPSQSFIDAQNRVKALQDTFAAVKANLETVFFSPISDLFSNFFETGKFAFADFGKTILKTIGQIVSKIIATGVINLLASLLLPPGTGTLVGATKGVGGAFKAAFNSILGGGGGNVLNPSFAGVGGGPMGMSGQVNVVLRGQDLVGALNRTNTTINRVG
jgi:hypothetical protein